MAAQALIGNDWKLRIGDGASPEAFEDLCAAFDLGEFGEEKPLVDITTFCSAAREYRNGLADGLEIPLQMNYAGQDVQLRTLYTAFKDDTLVTFNLVTKDSPTETYEFAATVRAWRMPLNANGERAPITFTLKVSGDIVWIQSVIAP